jgi:hypothetical protein
MEEIHEVRMLLGRMLQDREEYLACDGGVALPGLCSLILDFHLRRETPMSAPHRT